MKFLSDRPVSQSDIYSLEKRLLLTIDMITGKKRRIALEMHRRHKTHQVKSSLWHLLSSAVNRSDTDGDSKLIFINLLGKKL